MTNKEHIETYIKREAEGNFNVDINPVNWDECYPVTPDFRYINRTFGEKFSCALKNTFIINPYSWHHNNFVMKTKVVGRENLKGIKSAIVTCNHVYIFDCLAIKRALKHKVKFTVAEFNNRKGFLGDMMRAGGILPLSNKLSVLKVFNNAVEHHLLHDNYVVFYPEQAMWHMYEKPRPFKEGAFHYADKFDVPIIPLFISFRDSGKIDGEGLPIKYFTVHIMPPIYRNPALTRADSVKEMMQKNYDMCKAKYEEVYGKPLVYDVKE